MDPTDPDDILARTVYGEARGDGRRGMEAVACVILNRSSHPRWWGKDVLTVCRDPWQFSCWNQGDVNLPKLCAVTGSDPSFVTALAVAEDALAGRLADPTGGADSYFAIGTPEPDWTKTATHTCNILGHAFYRTELAAPASTETADDLNAAELSSIQGAST